MIYAIGGVVVYLALGVVGFLVRPRWLCGALAILAGGASLALWAPGFPEGILGGTGWGVSVAGDPLALGMWALALVIHGAVILHERTRPGAFHPLLTLLVGTCLATVLSRDLFNLYVTLELVSLLSFLLVGYEGKPRAVWASLQYLILATVGMTLYLLGVGLVYGKLGTLSLSVIAAMGPGFSDPAVAIGAGLLVAGAAIKGGVFLFGLWLPHAHGYAPTGVSVVLSAVVVKMGVVALARLAEALPVAPALVALGILTGFGGLVYALWERDLKVFLAFHTVSQLGYMLIGFGLGGPALFGAILYAVAHGLFKGLLFLSAGQAIEATGERQIAHLAGRLAWPCALGLAAGTWAIAGLPPLAGFSAKGALTADLAPVARAVLVAMSVGTAASFAKVIPLLRPGPKREASFGGVMVLIVALVGFGLWGFLRVPALLDPGKWAEAAGGALGGYGLYLLLRRVRPRLPRITLDRATVVALLGAAALAAGILVLG
ncbi:MAG: proton-conducting transporter membrane subunit [Candidatus Bipolaricaulota bacterium]